MAKHKFKNDSENKLLIYYKNGEKRIYYSIDWMSKSAGKNIAYGLKMLYNLVERKYQEGAIYYACISPNRDKARAFHHFFPRYNKWISDDSFKLIQKAKKESMANALVIYNHFGMMKRKKLGKKNPEKGYFNSLDILPVVAGVHPANALFDLYGKYLEQKDLIELCHIYMNGFSKKVAYITQNGDLRITDKSVRDTCSDYFVSLTPELYYSYLKSDLHIEIKNKVIF